MKKFLSIFMVLLVAVVIAACKPTDESTTGSGTTTAGTTAGTTTGSTTEETTTNPIDVLFPEQSPKAGDKVVRVATFGVGTREDMNLVRRRIYAFNELDNGIFIVPMNNDSGTGWDEWLATLASTGDLPEVVQLNNVPSAIISKWIQNITDLAEADTEWENIPLALRESITYNGEIYAIPAAYHYMGYFANIDLIESADSAAPVFTNFDYTIDQFLAAIRSITDVTDVTDGSGKIGINTPGAFVNWMPASYDSNLGHFVFDGTKFDFTGSAMKNTISSAVSILEGKHSFNAFSAAAGENDTPSERQKLFGDNWDGAVFRNNQMGFQWGASWDETGLANDIGNDFEYEFIGTPGGNVVGVSDYFAISRTAGDRDAAYEVAKWLTFGEDGINKAFELIQKAKTEEDKTFSLGGLPINEKAEIKNKWFEGHSVNGFKKAYELASEGKVGVLMEGNKYIPGFLQARFHFKTQIDAKLTRPNSADGATLTIGDFIFDASAGLINYDDYMNTDLEAIINAEFALALQQVLYQVSVDKAQ